MVLSTIIEIYSFLKECLSGSHKEETLDEAVPPVVATDDGGGGMIPFGAILESCLCAPFLHPDLARWQHGTSN